MRVRLLSSIPSLILLMLSLGSFPTFAQDADDDDFFEFDEGESAGAGQIADPFEGFNRAMFVVNDKLYRVVLKPVARGLRILPTPVRRSANNFFVNLGAPISAISALLQGDLRNAGSEGGRFLVNTTIGILGFFDPATDMGLIQDEEDLGQTLGRWGVGPGIYLVLPFMGSTSLRDFPGMIATNRLNPVYYDLDSNEIIAINIIGAEVALSLDQDTYEAFYRDALDPYVFFRSAWAQNREGRIAR